MEQREGNVEVEDGRILDGYVDALQKGGKEAGERYLADLPECVFARLSEEFDMALALYLESQDRRRETSI